MIGALHNAMGFLYRFCEEFNGLYWCDCIILQVERKRHIGNDIVNIIFIDSCNDAPTTGQEPTSSKDPELEQQVALLPTMFDPAWIKSQFTRKPYKRSNLWQDPVTLFSIQQIHSISYTYTYIHISFVTLLR